MSTASITTKKLLGKLIGAALIAAPALAISNASANEVITDDVHMWSKKGGWSSVCKINTRYVGNEGFSLAVPILNGHLIEYRKEDSWGIIRWFGSSHDDNVREVFATVELLNSWPDWGYVQYKVCGGIDDATANPFGTPPITYVNATIDILVLD